MATQDEINSFVEQIMPYFDPAPVEEDTVQQSWPRLDRGLSDIQDMTRFQHQYGIFDWGGQPYWLRTHGTDAATNERNTLRLTVSTTTGTAESTIRGAFHRLREDMELSFPAVSANTTYYVVVSYDPIRTEDGGDPLEVEVLTSLNRTQGRDYIVLWEVVRKPSQLLTDAVRRQIRPKVVPTFTVDQSEQLPSPSTMLWGTQVTLTHGNRRGETFIASGASGDTGGPTQWVSFTSPPWVPIPLTSAFRARWSTPSYRLNAGVLELRGIVERANGAALPVNTVNTFADIPELVRNGNYQAFPVAATNSRKVRVEVQGEAQQLRYFCAESGVTWFSLDGVRIQLPGWA